MSSSLEPSRGAVSPGHAEPLNGSRGGKPRAAINVALVLATVLCLLIAGYAPVGGLRISELNAADTAAKPTGDQSAAATVDFNRDVRPILSKSCVKCHGPDDGFRPAGLRLDTREGATATLESGGIAIVSGDPDASELITRVTLPDGETGAMPPKAAGERLSPEQVEILRKWIAAGAPYAKHWSLQAPIRPAVPQVVAPAGKTAPAGKSVSEQPAKDQAAAKDAGSTESHPIDAFIRQRLIAANLDLQPEAERHVLARRLSFDLRGLPPTLEEVAEFEADTRPDAYIRLVDRMLADSAYGERWARIWLDLARYADSAGYGSDPLRLNAWRYRDWVIDSFNQNKPYDQFTIEQIAGDLLPNATVDQRMATAFHRNTMTNTEGGTDDEEFRMAAVKDRTDTTMQVWMGLTLGCAKCHNHKFDPFTRREYYEMMAFFNQTADADRGDELPVMEAPTEEFKAKSQQIDEQIAVLRQKLDTATPELAAAQQAWEETLQSTSEWLPLSDARVQSAAGTAFEVQSDGSWLATGPVTDNDTYTVTAIVDPATFKDGVTGVRLQTIPDPRLPNSGAGRASDGNFVLSRFLVQQSELAVEQTAGDAAGVGSSGNTPRTEPAKTGRRVRIRLPGSDKYLHIAELEVFSRGKNVARTGTATQSSTDYGGDAARAIDGNPDGNYYGSNSVTHTRTETDPWWQVELAAETPIEEIRLHNRTDGGTQSRLNSAVLEVLDSANAVVWSTTIDSVIETSKSWSLLGPQTVPIAVAAADFSQAAFPVQSAATGADPAGTGWAVAPHFQTPHAAVFAFANPLRGTRPVELRIVLEHSYRLPQFLLGRFAIQVTSDEKLQNRNSVHPAILAIVDTPAATRTPQQQTDLANYYRSIAPQLTDVRNAIVALEHQRPKSVTLPIMQELPEGQRRKTHVLEKANFLLPLEEVQSGTPASLHARKLRNENRLDVASWLVDAENPLTARVAVNRFWSQLFGRGIVETEEDFGTQGALPSHPELLDWLAVEFQQPSIMRNPQGALRPWDIKGLLRLIVTSRTYRQSSRVTPLALQIDPRNTLLSRAPRYRLEAEMVRDQALALSGLLSRKIGGPSVYPVQPDGLWQAAFNGERTWSTSTGDDRYRRGLYTFWRRTVPYPSMATFDAPSREACTIRRSRTNTPLQAFVTLNDPVYVEAAQALARRMMQHGGATVDQRLVYGLQLCTCRRPGREQVEKLQALYQSELAWYQANESAAVELATVPLGALPARVLPAEAAAWTVVANVLLNMDAVLTRN